MTSSPREWAESERAKWKNYVPKTAKIKQTSRREARRSDNKAAA